MLTVVMVCPLFSLRKGQASTLRSLMDASVTCSSPDADTQSLHWKEADSAGASALLRLATNTTSGSVILAFKVMFRLAESSGETKMGPENF